MIRTRVFQLALLSISLAIQGCVTGPTNLTPRAAGVTSACCLSVQSIPASADLSFRATRADLGPNSPHYDFGSGLAPTIAFSVPESLRGGSLELRSMSAYTMQLASQRSYYLASSVIFFDLHGQRISASVSGPKGKRIGSASDPFRLVRSVQIPMNAVKAIFTSDQQLVGTIETVRVAIEASVTPVAGIMIANSARTVDHTFENSAYGSQELIVIPK